MNELSPTSLDYFSVSAKRNISLVYHRHAGKKNYGAFQTEEKIPYPGYPICGPIILSMPQETFLKSYLIINQKARQASHISTIGVND